MKAGDIKIIDGHKYKALSSPIYATHKSVASVHGNMALARRDYGNVRLMKDPDYKPTPPARNYRYWVMARDKK